MKKIKHYVPDSGETYYNFHLNVFKATRHVKGWTPGCVDDKVLIENRSSDLKIAFYEYKWRFENDSLECLQPIKKTKSEENAFFKQYSYSKSCFGRLRHDLMTDDNGKLESRCPLCQLDTVSTLDHCVPRNPEFQEFSDHPLNLIPSCSICNGKKGNRWKNYKGKRSILNLYIDDIPNVQYLFVKIDLNLSCDFYVKKNDMIDIDLYERIENNYGEKGLKLCQRYSESAGTFIDELVCALTDVQINDTSNRILKTDYEKMAKKLQNKFGVNYWKAVLLLEISENNDIMNVLKFNVRNSL